MIDAVLLIGFGGPTRREEIRPFLDNVLRGRPVPKERYEEVVHHYEAMGGRSPYNDHAMRQAEALRARLLRDEIDIPVVVGMRNWPPMILDAMRELRNRRASRVLGFVLAAHRCEASWDRYQSAVEAARAEIGPSAPAIDYPQPWHTHPKFIEAAAARVSETLAQLDQNEAKAAELIFTAHSIPVAMDAASGYAAQIRESAAAVASKLNRDSWQLAFQSRSGAPRDAWLEPEIGAVIRKLEKRTAIVMPIGFLCDHIEVLYDLDVEAAKIACECGVKMIRAGTVGDHPAFIDMIAEIVREHLRQ
ncbi:MAG TPA: ferrochelatase [Candidatus Binataceae bacterium]|nr:ferrochelatase [Candidatus Binataceae bacterium]